MAENPEFLTIHTEAEPPKEIPLDFNNLRLKPGEKVIFLDRRQFGHNEGDQLAWQDTLQMVFEEEAEKFPKSKLNEWKIRWVTLPCGDTALFAATDVEPDKDGFVPAALIAIAEEKWTVGDFLLSVGDDRFFGSDSEIKRIADAEPRDGQALFAYREQGEVYDSATHTKTIETINNGVVDSLARDYGVRTYQITTPELYALRLSTFARRWDHIPSTKSALLEPKRGITILQSQKYLLSYAFRPNVVQPVLDRFGTPGEAFLALKQVPWTPGGNISKKKTAVNPFAGIPYCGEEGLSRANAIVWKKQVDAKEEPKEEPPKETPPAPPKETPAEKPVIRRHSPGFEDYKEPEKPPVKPPLVYENNAGPLDESFRLRSSEQEQKLLNPLLPEKKPLTREEIRAKITDETVKGI